MAAKAKIIQTIGKRKQSTARATLYPTGKGIIKVNHVPIQQIKPNLARERIMEPLQLSDESWHKININVKVSGGGSQGQTEAVRLAIARALVENNKKLKKTFLDYDRHLLIQDIRRKEQRKPNDSKARSARQKSYR